MFNGWVISTFVFSQITLNSTFCKTTWYDYVNRFNFNYANIYFFFQMFLTCRNESGEAEKLAAEMADLMYDYDVMSR